MTPREMQGAIFDNAMSKGFHTACRGSLPHFDPKGIQAKLMLIVSEVAEACECARESDFALRFEANGKPVGFPSELADVVIRTLDQAEAMGFDLWEVVEKKHAYNKTRAFMHGGKTI